MNPSDSNGADSLRARIAELERALRELRLARDQARARVASEALEVDAALGQEDAASRAGLEARVRELDLASARRREAIDATEARDLARIERAAASATSKSDAALSFEKARIAEECRKASEQTARDIGRHYARQAAEVEEGKRELEELRKGARELEEETQTLAARVGLRALIAPPDPDAPDPVPHDDLAEAAKEVVEESRGLLVAARRDRWVRFARFSPPFLVLLGLIIVVLGGGLLAVREYRPDQFPTVLEFVLPISALALLSVAILFRSWAGQRSHMIIDPLLANQAELAILLQCRENWLKKKERTGAARQEKERDERVRQVEEAYRVKEAAADKVAAVRAGVFEDSKARLNDKARQRKERRLSEEAVRLEGEKMLAEEGVDREGGRRKEPHTRRRGELSSRERSEMTALAMKWRQATTDFQRASEEARRRSRERHPAWNEKAPEAWKLPAAFPEGAYLGEMRFDWAALSGIPAGDETFAHPEGGGVRWPLDLSFPGRGHLLIGADPECRAAAMKGLFTAVLRILASFPPGKARFTVFDPVGLGQNFSALMHLADFEESLVGGRLWTETSHIEKKLAETTEHIEKVIQKYLRNKYATIHEYNREVGTMAEPYRFLVIADFPTAFSELAQERLASILTSGARCGVYVLILWDKNQKLPAALDLPRLKEAGVVLKADKDGYQLEEESLDRGRLTIEAPPPAEALTALLHSIGKQAAAAERVELPFEVVVPAKDRWWIETTDNGIKIPLGRAGADRLQHLELGRGTAQHCLIAGKTGSGKSTLFHVMITSSALWYSPRELELYLIDFKKGVEFKTYATNRLPHARAVAIESDREFGLSVLRRIDRELAGRAEQYRKAGVQDFAGFRRAAPDQRIPRTLLMIDEFQEFFTEEDGIAQEAALLLDRIVRQGRAFGVHVILGSQTLGGSYTLARTTLGQMAVRIALQCNEADSYLILNDENSAARLLSRPGEAIYNDMAGMLEGNNPFQVVWLPDELRDRLLHDVGGREGAGDAREPMAVFEGNVPADIRNNLPLRERLARPGTTPDVDSGVTAWIGEANAIKGPTEVRFRNQGGSHLMIVGQQRESALSVITSAVVSVAAAHPPRGARFILFDGSTPEHGLRPSDLAETIPHGIEVVEQARIPEVMAELAAEMKGREDGSRKSDARIFLVVYDLQRFRALRMTDEFDMGEGKPTPDRQFVSLLTEGPAQKMHAIVWADSLATLNRTINRKTLKEFQMRVLFQMSAADSSELIDTPQAGKLGLYRGLLFLEEHGTVEKFRPYSPPEAETLTGIRQALGATGMPRSR